MNRDEGFVSRWARRKAQVRAGLPVDEPPVAADPVAPLPQQQLTVTPPAATAIPPGPSSPETSLTDAPEAPPIPTMDDVAALARDAADFSRFVAPEVPTEVRNAAMKKMFTDPHFNVMDGLDVYIDDYSKPDPLPRSMLRSLVQSKLLGLFDDEPQAAPAPAVALPADSMAMAEPAEPVTEPSQALAGEPDVSAQASEPLDDVPAQDAKAASDDEPSSPPNA